MLRISRKQSIFKRHYHYDKDIYGYRTPRPFEMPDYTPEELENRIKNANLLRLVQQYRIHGHRNAELDPLGINKKEDIYQLNPERFGIESTGQKFKLSGILHVGKTNDPSISKESATVEKIIQHLKSTYCSRIGFEFSHLPSASERRWFATLVESYDKKQFSLNEKLNFHSLLAKSETFDAFMAKKFPQVKRYGLEGAESMLITLFSLFKDANAANVSDIILCMPHRGRLNLLSVMLKLNPEVIFSKVKGKSEFPNTSLASGDVLSHLGASVNLDFGFDSPIHISMMQNPSHLEAANPVALGKARAKQMDLNDENNLNGCFLGDKVLCVQMHGDSAFTGQGVVTETLGLSNLPHYTVGGSVHIIVNNQIGYTTPAMNARSSLYTSDIGKMINCPIIHVNGDFPEDVAYATSIAFEYRNKFRKDVILDLIAYRRLGHNELDEPGFTQPQMYQNIRNRTSVAKLYESKLAENNQSEITEKLKNVKVEYDQELEKALGQYEQYIPKEEPLSGKWAGLIKPSKVDNNAKTGVNMEDLKKIGIASVTPAENMKIHPRIQKYHIDGRIAKLKQGKSIDWATAEALAFGSLLVQGFNVRISGQDVGRGTFSQRHAMLVDQETERTIIPLNRMDKEFPSQNLGRFEIANSSLSEFAVMGFEYGMSWEDPNRLCIWEAQFGDFFNGAQIIIDTYIGSGEAKWEKQTGLVLLLPHGYDGGGPEHSSARIERFLQLCDQPVKLTGSDVNPNMHIVNPTTPAQYFHVLRRQMTRNYRKPLVVFSPKLLLRHPLAISSLSDMDVTKVFERVLGDSAIINPETVEKVCFLSGKIYYDLIKERAALGMDQKISFIRIEELNPFPEHELLQEISKFKNAKEWIWVQEEAENAGAYTYMQPRIKQLLKAVIGDDCLGYVGRNASAAPATGIGMIHREEIKNFLTRIFN